MTTRTQNGALTLEGLGAKDAPIAPAERPKSLPLEEHAGRVARLGARIAEAARKAAGLDQDALGCIFGLERRGIAKHESAQEPRHSPQLRHLLIAPHAYAITLINELLRARARLYPSEPTYMLTPVGAAVHDMDEDEIVQTATRESCEAIAALANPTLDAATKLREAREAMDAKARVVALFQAKSA